MSYKPTLSDRHLTSNPLAGGAPDTRAASTAKPASRTILAVDDDPIILMNTAALLEDLGHRVFEANSGQEALDRLAAGPEIDLLITDQSMPGMSGSELILAARILKPDLPVILATGYDGPADADAPGVTRLGKPFNFAELEAAVARADA